MNSSTSQLATIISQGVMLFVVNHGQTDFFEAFAALAPYFGSLEEIAFVCQKVTRGSHDNIALCGTSSILKSFVKFLLFQEDLPDVSVFVTCHNLENGLSGEEPVGVFRKISQKTQRTLTRLQHRLIVYNLLTETVDGDYFASNKRQDMPL
jgi:hypothetical protein